MTISTAFISLFALLASPVTAWVAPSGRLPPRPGRSVSSSSSSKTTGGRGEVVSLKYVDHVQHRVDRNEDGHLILISPIRTKIVLSDPCARVVAAKTSNAHQNKKQVARTASPSQPTLIALGMVLAANSGFLNGLTLSGILGNNMACAAVTGAWTNSALKLGAGNFAGFGAQMAVICAYVAGSFLNGMLHPNGVDWTTNPSTSRTLLGVAALVLGGSALHSVPLLAMANGWQNSWTSMLIKGNVIRSTHFSGITSDLGTFVGQILRLKRQGKGQDEATTNLIWKVQVQLSIVLSFFVGGLLSVACTNLWGSAKTSILASIVVYLASFAALRLRPQFKPKQQRFLSRLRRILRKPQQQQRQPTPAPATPLF